MEFKLEHKTWYDKLFGVRNVFVEVSMVLFSVLILAGLSNIRVPLWPVPVTMQTFGVFIIAFFFGSRKGALTMLTYLLFGIVGVNVFSGWNSGLSYFMGPTGGYLVGFIFSVFIVGKLVENGWGRTKTGVIKAMFVGNCVIYSFGLVGLWYFFGESATISKVLMSGLVPFLIGDIVKMVGASYLFPKIWKLNT